MQEVDGLARVCALAVSAGADGASFLRGEDVVFDRAFREICARNACGIYGRCHMCPPAVGDIDVLIAKARAYSAAVLYQTISSIEDSFDVEGMLAAGNRHAGCSRRLEESLRTAGVPSHLHLASGGCRFCARCAAADGLPCRSPAHAMSSLEAYGIDVYRTALHANLKYVNGQNTVTYFGIVLIGEKENA